jgi:hypothetical protein
MCVVWYKKEKFLSVQVKNKHCDEGAEHAFILGSTVYMVANNNVYWFCTTVHVPYFLYMNNFMMCRNLSLIIS